MSAWTATIGTTGLVVGKGTTYPWAIMPDLFGVPEIRTVDYYRPARHGEVAGQDLLAARTVVLEVHVNAAIEEDAETALHQLTVAFSAVDADTTLDIEVTGAVAYRLYGRPRGVEVALDKQVRGGVIRARCTFKAMDPRLYIAAAQTLPISLAGGGGGLTFNATADFTFGGAVSGGTATATVAGTIPVPWVATMTGPLTNPIFEHVGQGRQIALVGTVNAGETLVVDSDARTILLNGTTSRYSFLSSTSRWFDLTPGANLLAFRTSSGTGTLSLAYRAAYI